MKFQNLALLFTLLVAGSGCVQLPKPPGPKQIFNAKGKVSYVVQCYKKSGCSDTAKELCPGGYTILNSKSDPVTLDITATVRTATKHEWEIRCK